MDLNSTPRPMQGGVRMDPYSTPSPTQGAAPPANAPAAYQLLLLNTRLFIKANAAVRLEPNCHLFCLHFFFSGKLEHRGLLFFKLLRRLPLHRTSLKDSRGLMCK